MPADTCVKAHGSLILVITHVGSIKINEGTVCGQRMLISLTANSDHSEFPHTLNTTTITDEKQHILSIMNKLDKVYPIFI